MVRFLADTRVDKRSRLIDELLTSPGFASLAALRWCDVLRVKSEFPINLWPRSVEAYPPPGVSLAAVDAAPGGWNLTLAAGADQPPVGMRDNLIVQVSVEHERAPAKAKGGAKARVPLGCLPAVPIEIVAGR